MSKLLKYLVIIVPLLFLTLPIAAEAAPTIQNFTNIAPFVNDKYDDGTTTPSQEWFHVFTKILCLSGDCRSVWPSASGSGNVSTSSSESSGFIPFWTSNSATPALLSGGTSSFVWDSVNNRLGISSSTPGFPLSIGSTDQTSSPWVSIGGLNQSNYGIAISGGRTMLGYTTGGEGDAVLASGSGHGIVLETSGAANAFPNSAMLTPGICIAGGTGGCASNTGGTTAAGNVGIGTSTPYAKLSVMIGSLSASQAPSVAFAIGSTTKGTATSTLFSVNSTGSTTLASTFGTCSGSNALTTDSGGTIVCGAITGNGGGIGDPFTHPAAGQSATTSLMLSYGNASTTQLTATSSVYLATEAGKVGVGTTAPSNLFTVEGNQAGGIVNFQRDFPGNTPFGTAIGTFLVTAFESTTTNMLASTTGPAFIFRAATSTANPVNLADIVAIQSGNSDFNGDLALRTYNAGTPSEVMRLSTTGNVGIGSTSPYAALSVVGSTGIVADHITATSTANQSYIVQGLTIGDPTLSRTTYPFTVVGTNNTTGIGDFGLMGDVNLGTTNGNTIGFQHAQMAAGGVTQTTAGWDWRGDSHTNGAQSTSIIFSTRNAGSFGARLTINFNGNIGIGTTTPAWPLQVAGTRPSLAISDNGAATNFKHWLFTSEGGNLYIGTTTDVFATSTPAAISVTNAGFVGIGSSSPTVPLVVTLTNPAINNTIEADGNNGQDSQIVNINLTSGKGAYLKTQANSNFASLEITGTGSDWKFGEFGSTDFTLLDGTNVHKIMNVKLGAPADTLDITAAGNVGINDSNASAKLSVVGSAVIGFASNQAGITNGLLVKTNVGIGTTTLFATLAVNPVAGGASNQFVVGSSTGTSFIINNNGFVGVATTTPWRTFSVNGTQSWTGLTSASGGNAVCIGTTNDVENAGTQACTISSIRFKQNVQPLSGTTALSILKDVDGYSYDYKIGYYSPEDSPHGYGPIAEYVAKTHPELVDFKYDGTPGDIFWNKLTGLNTDAINEIQVEINNIQTGKTVRSVEENWQWGAIGLLILWNLYLTFRKEKWTPTIK